MRKYSEVEKRVMEMSKTTRIVYNVGGFYLGGKGGKELTRPEGKAICRLVSEGLYSWLPVGYGEWGMTYLVAGKEKRVELYGEETTAKECGECGWKGMVFYSKEYCPSCDMDTLVNSK